MARFDGDKFNTIKRVIYSITAVVVCFFLVIYVFISNNFKTKAIYTELNKYFLEEIGKVSKQYNYRDKELKFQINGSVRLKIFPDIKIVINDIELKNVRYNDYLVSGTIKSVEISLSIWDVLQKNLNMNNILINGGQLIFEYNLAEEFYFKKVKVKKIVKLEENEVIGIKDKLKEILTDNKSENTQQIKDGYKEILVEENEKVLVDNSNIKDLLTRLIFDIKLNNMQHTNFVNGVVNLTNLNINLVKNNSIDKEYKNISGVISRTSKTNFKVNVSMLLGGVNSNVDFTMSKKSGEIFVNSKITNMLEDTISFELNTKSNIDNLTKLFYVDGIKKISFSTKSFNKMVQWLFPSSFSTVANYNGEIAGNFELSTFDNMKHIDIKEISLTSDDVMLNGNISLNDNENIVKLDIEKINFDNFIIENNSNNGSKQDNLTTTLPNIFNISNLDELNNFIKSKQNNTADNKNDKNKQYKVSLNIKQLIIGEKVIKDSIMEFDIIDGLYHIDNFNLKIDDYEVIINNKTKYEDVIVNDLVIKGLDIRKIADNFYVGDLLSFKEFEVVAKLVAFKDTIYIVNSTIKNNSQNITGNFELKLLNNGYLAGDLKVDKINYDISKSQQIKIKTLKEKLLILNNIKNSVFLKLNVDDFNYGDLLKNTKIISSLHLSNGVIDFYNIEDISNDFFHKLNGNMIFDISGSKPKININIQSDSVKYNMNLLELMININKYKSAIFEDEKQYPELKSYWVNKIFEVPTLDDIDGNININFDKVLFNGNELEKFAFFSKINDGLVQIDNFSFLGLGGKTNIKGTIVIKDNKAIDLSLSDTIYNIKELNHFFIGNSDDILDGTIGLRGIVKAQGYDRKGFLATMNLSSDFIGKQLYVKKIGLENIQKIMNDKTSDFKNIQLDKMILDDSGTTFKDFKGNLTIKNNILSLKCEASANLYSSNILLKIDNNGSKPLFNFNNISSFIFMMNEEKKTPFYYSMNFVEDFDKKAYLKYDLSQVDELLEILKKNQLENEKQQ